MPVRSLGNLDCKNKTVVIREDFNVPMKDGRITNDKRLRAALPTIRMVLERGGRAILLSHLGRPAEGEFDAKYSLRPVAEYLQKELGRPVELAGTIEDAKNATGDVVLLENIRFFKGEKKNDKALAGSLANLGDIYVMDAFGSAHRAHASTDGAIRSAKIACAGPLMQAELEAFSRIMDKPAHPFVAIIGGAKVSTKLSVLENLIEKVDCLIVGGGIANTFLAAAGHTVGKSLYEPDLIPEAQKIMRKAEELGKKLPLPVDVVTACALLPDQKTEVHSVNDVPADQMILDIGPNTVALYEKFIADAATVIWNGPVGAFETEPFGNGTRALADFLAKSRAYVVVGGGDSVAAVEKYGLADKMGYISTGGGASLELLEGKKLPSIAALEDCSN